MNKYFLKNKLYTTEKTIIKSKIERYKACMGALVKKKECRSEYFLMQNIDI